MTDPLRIQASPADRFGLTFDAIDEAVAKDEQETLKRGIGRAVGAAAETDPDAYARDIALAKQVDLPVDTVAADREDAERRARQMSEEQLQEVLSQPQNMREWWADPDNVKMIADDYPLPSRWQKTWRDTGRARELGGDDLEIANLRRKQINHGLNSLTPEEQTRLEALNESLDREPPLGTGDWWSSALVWSGRTLPMVEQVIGGGARGAAIGSTATGGVSLALGPAAPFGWAAGAVAGGLTGSFYESMEINAALALNEALKIRDEQGNTVDPEIALNISRGVGVLTGALDTTGLAFLARTFPGLHALRQQLMREGVRQVMKDGTKRQALAAVGRRYVEGIAVEGATEGIQQAIQAAGEEFDKLLSEGDFKYRSVSDFASESAEAAGIGLLVGGVYGAPPSALSASIAAARNPKMSPAQVQAHVEAINDSVRQDKLFQRSPDRFHDLMSRITGDERFYARRDVVVDVIAQLPVEQREALLSSATGLREEIESPTGADVSIRKADYATYIAPYPQADLLKDHIKLDPADMSIADRQAFQELLQNQPQIAEAVRRQIAEKPPQGPEELYKPLERLFRKAIRESGRSGQEAKNVAPFFARTLARYASAFGENAFERVSQMFLGFQTLDEQGQPIKQSSNIDVLLSDLERVDEVNDKGEYKLDEATRTALKRFAEKINAAGITPQRAREMGGKALYDQLYPQAVQSGPAVQLASGQQLTLPNIQVSPGDGGGVNIQVTPPDETAPVIGRYLTAEESTLQQRVETTGIEELGFKSKMQQVLEQKLNATGTPAQIKEQINALIKNGAFKQEEYFWSGLEDWLDNTNPETRLTKADVLEFLQDSANFDLEEVGEQVGEGVEAPLPDISESDFTERDPEYNEDEYRIEEEAKEYYYPDILKDKKKENHELPEEDRRSEEEIEQEALEEAVKLAEESAREDEYNYTYRWYLSKEEFNKLDIEVERHGPDGEYQVLIDGKHIDDVGDWPEVISTITQELMDRGYEIGESEDLPEFGQFTAGGGTNYSFWRLRVPTGLVEGEQRGNAHYRDSDVVAHYRTKDRIGPDGEKMLFIEEVQSDLHQEAYKLKKRTGIGYRTDIPKEERIRIGREAQEAEDAHRTANEQQNQVEIDMEEEVKKLIPNIDDSSARGLREMITAALLGDANQREQIRGGLNFTAINDIVEQAYAQGTVNYDAKRALAYIKGALNFEYEVSERAGQPFDYQGALKAIRNAGVSKAQDQVIELMERKDAPLAWTTDQAKAAFDAALDKFGVQWADLEATRTSTRADMATKREKLQAVNEAPPLAPFSKTWREVAFKRLLVRAQEGGYQSVGWSTGSAQNYRYNLSNYIDNLQAQRLADGSYNIKSEPRVMRAIRETIGGNAESQAGFVALTDQQLETVLGKEGADAVRAQADTGSFSTIDFAKTLEVETAQGSKTSLYDNVFVNETKKILRKVGAEEPHKIDYKTTEKPGESRAKVFPQIWYAKLPEQALEKIKEGFELFQKERGFIQFNPGQERDFANRLRRVMIAFTSRANFSTAAHEFSHWAVATHRMFAELARERIAAGQGSPELQRIADDWQALKDYVGATDDVFTVEQEEKLAKTFEAYLRDGNAPSEGLRRVFATFRIWLSQIYHDIRESLGIEAVDPKVAGVFDRWLASQEEIAAVRGGIGSLSDIARTLGLEEAVVAKIGEYVASAQTQAEESLFKEMSREQRATETKAYQEEFDRERKKVAADYLQRREYNLMNFMRERGLKFIEGPETDGLPEDVVGGDAHPDELADLFGFESGQAMLTRLRGTPDFDRSVNRETRRRLLAKYPDMIEQKRIRNKAMAAVYNDRVLLGIDLIIRELGRAKGAPRESLKRYAEVLAQEQVAKTRMKDVNYSFRYEVQREKEMREALKSAREGDAEAAMAHLQRAMVNQIVFKSLEEFKELRAKAEKLFDRVNKRDKDLAPTKDIDFINAARALLAKFGLSASNFNVRQWMDELFGNEEKGIPGTDPDLRQDLVLLSGLFDDDVPPKPAGELTVAEFTDIYNAVQNLYHVAHNLKELEIEGRKVKVEQAVAELISKVDTAKIKPMQGTETLGWDKFRMTVSTVKAALRRVEQWSKAMDGGESGPWRTYLWNRASDAQYAYLQARRQWLGRYRDILVKNKKRLRERKKIDSGMVKNADGQSTPLVWHDRMQMIGFLLHTGNASNLDKLLGGYGIDPANFRAAMLDLENRGVITKQDWDMVQELWDLAEDMKPMMQQANKALYGFREQMIDPLPVTTAYGTYRGGYWPALADPTQARDNRIAEKMAEDARLYMQAVVGKRFLKKRAEKYRQPLRTDLRLGAQHIDEVLRFVHLEPAARDIRYLLRNKELVAALETADPDSIKGMIIPFLQRFVRQSTEPRPELGDRAASMGRRLLHSAQSSVTSQLIRYNPLTAIQNIANLSVAAHQVGPRNFAKAFVSLMASPVSTWRTMITRSDMMYLRLTTNAAKINDQVKYLSQRNGQFSRGRDFLKRHGFIFFQVIDGMVGTIAWTGAFNRYVEENPEAPESDAVRHADAVAREVMAGMAPIDISKFEASHPLVRTFISPFMGYFNSQANLLGTEFRNIMRQYGWLGSPRLFMAYVMIVAAPALISAFLVQGLKNNLPGDDDHDGEIIDDWLTWMGLEQLKYLAAFVPGAGTAVNSAVNAAQGKTGDTRVSFSPAVSLLESGLRTSQRLVSEKPQDDSAMIRDALMSLGFVTGYPIGQLSKPLGYVANVEEHDEPRPRNALDFGRGLIAGPTPKKRKRQ